MAANETLDASDEDERTRRNFWGFAIEVGSPCVGVIVLLNLEEVTRRDWKESFYGNDGCIGRSQASRFQSCGLAVLLKVDDQAPRLLRTIVPPSVIIRLLLKTEPVYQQPNIIFSSPNSFLMEVSDSQA